MRAGYFCTNTSCKSGSSADPNAICMGYSIDQRDRIDAAFREAWADFCPDIDPDHVPSMTGTIIVLHRMMKRLRGPSAESLAMAQAELRMASDARAQ